MQDIEAIRVLNRREAVKHLGISERSFQRLEALGDAPPKTRLSEGRIGYRVCDLAKWLDARRGQRQPGSQSTQTGNRSVTPLAP